MSRKRERSSELEEFNDLASVIRAYRKQQTTNAYHLLVPLFSSFTGSVVCHMLPLFGCSASSRLTSL